MAQKQLKPEEFVKKEFPKASQEVQSEILNYAKRYNVDIRSIGPETSAVISKALGDPKLRGSIGKVISGVLSKIRGPKKG